MKFLLTILTVFSAIAGFAQIGAKTNTIHGTWINNDFGYQMTIILKANGTGEFDGEAMTFKSDGGKLSITQYGETNVYNFKIENNRLTVSGGDLEGPITLTRQGSESSGQHPSGNSGAKLIGAWSNYGETWEFKPNGQCIYLEKTYQYIVSGTTITVKGGDANDLVMPFQIKDNELKLYVNGNEFAYYKGASTGNSGNSNAANSSKNVNQTKGKLDQSIVGKWCYVNVTSTSSGGSSTDECITINADGTYSYYSERSMSSNTSGFSAGTASQNSDGGTWWVEGDRIFYNSRNQGQGSYQLQKLNHPKTNDPMIVLDGTAYVSYLQRSPW